MKIYLSRAVADAMRDAAARAFPDEACGLLEGVDGPGTCTITAFHEAKNLAEDKRTKFLIDPQAQFDLMHKLEGTNKRIVACFHSHPDSVARPSDTDLEDAKEMHIYWLVAGGEPEFGFSLAAFTIDRGYFRSVGMEILQVLPETVSA